MTIPEEHGGLGMGLSELAIVLEAVGRNLAPEPFLSTVLLSANAILLGGSEALKAEWLPRIAAGEAVVGFAYQEQGSRYSAGRGTTLRDGRLNGRKLQALDVVGADALIVTTDGPMALIDPGAPGVKITRQARVDGRNAALVAFEDVAVDESQLIDGAVLDAVTDRATIGLCAEMLGGMGQAFEDTLTHLRQRRQFGVAIGSFQALKHRAARVFLEVTLARSAVAGAARALDRGKSDVPLLASMAKARCSDAYVLVANEGVQMFGGVGMTEEYDIGMYMKRARAAEVTFGDAAFHRDRWARLKGY